MAAFGEASPKLLSTYFAKLLSSLLVTPMYFLSPQSLSDAYSSHPFVWMTFSDKHLSWGCPLSYAFSSKEPAHWKWLYLKAGHLAWFLRGFSGDRTFSVEVLFATLCFSLMSLCVVMVFPLILSSVSLLHPVANEATLGLLLFSCFLLRGRSLWQPSCFSINRESSEAYIPIEWTVSIACQCQQHSTVICVVHIFEIWIWKKSHDAREQFIDLRRKNVCYQVKFYVQSWMDVLKLNKRETFKYIST